jgi:hypothetical protein
MVYGVLLGLLDMVPMRANGLSFVLAGSFVSLIDRLSCRPIGVCLACRKMFEVSHGMVRNVCDCRVLEHCSRDLGLSILHSVVAVTICLPLIMA